MSVSAYGKEFLPNQPHNSFWCEMAIDANDVFTNPLNGARVTITGVTVGSTNAATSVAYTVSGTFTAGPATLSQFKAWLMAGALVRTSYRGGAATAPQWPITEQDKAGISSGEYVVRG
jgi:hypothetical protein